MNNDETTAQKTLERYNFTQNNNSLITRRTNLSKQKNGKSLAWIVTRCELTNN